MSNESSENPQLRPIIMDTPDLNTPEMQESQEILRRYVEANMVGALDTPQTWQQFRANHILNPEPDISPDERIYVHSTLCVLHIIHHSGEEYVKFRVPHMGRLQHQLRPEHIKEAQPEAMKNLFRTTGPVLFEPFHEGESFYLMPSSIVKMTPYLVEEFERLHPRRDQFEGTTPPSLSI